MNLIFRLFFILVFFAIRVEASAQPAFSTDALSNPKLYRAEIDQQLQITEVPVFAKQAASGKVLLENGYAKYLFKNPDEWPPLQGQKVIPTKVRVIFTKYPKDSAFWLTDYQWLLSKRLNALFSLDSNLNSKDIEYSILLQTDCDNEFETMQLFHGIEISYRLETQVKTAGHRTELDSKNQDMSLSNSKEFRPAEVRNKSSIKKLNQLMYKEKYSMDSTEYKALDRNDHWNNALLVMDWTGSMRGYGAEALMWQSMFEDSSGIEHCAFFNDGDRKKNRKKIIGNTGGIYLSKAKPVYSSVKMMRKVQSKGDGGDSPENDVEALITAIKNTPEAKEIILVADNNSCIRDYVLLSYINRPVHVILCGTQNGINHQYLNLAWRTGGSIHTETMDLDSIDVKLQSSQLVIDGVRFGLTPYNAIVPLNRAENNFAHCDRYIKPTKRKRAKRRKEPKCYFTE